MMTGKDIIKRRDSESSIIPQETPKKTREEAVANVAEAHSGEANTPAKEAIDWKNLDIKDIGRLFHKEEKTEPLTPEEAEAQKKKRTIIWSAFAAACVLALIIPAGIVFTRSQNAQPAQDNGAITVTPVGGNSTASNPTTSTVATSPALDEATATVEESADKTEDALEELELLATTGYRNVFAPVNGERVKDAASGINPLYYANAVDALYFSVNTGVYKVAVTLPKLAVPNNLTATDGTEGTTDGTVTTTGGTTVDAATGQTAVTSGMTKIVLKGVGTKSGKKIAAFKVGTKTYEAGVDDAIGSTGFTVSKITSTSATIDNGTTSYTLTIQDGSK